MAGSVAPHVTAGRVGWTVSVTMTGRGGGQYVESMMVKPLVFTGAKVSGPIGAETDGVIAPTSTSLSQSITPQAVGSALFLLGVQGCFAGNNGAATAGTNCFMLDTGGANGTYSIEDFGTSGGPTLTTSTASQTLAMTSAGSAPGWEYILFEVLAAASPAPTLIGTPFGPLGQSQMTQLSGQQPITQLI